ncbi:MAG: M20/M25/M40 family metallo-hydrolase [Planctomycetales bacterium]|nr:M20/M25/M40 family metallo-hydrolase [Planctomycetales bacterium]
MSASAREILAKLVSLPSVNPRLTGEGDPDAGESRVTAWLCEYFANQSWRWLTQPVHPGRSNVAAVVPGRPDRILLWEAHQDTVAVAGMADPFAGDQRDGRLYGRGACDVKGGLAAMLAAATAASGLAPVERRPTIVLAATVNEECGFSGIRALASLWDPQQHVDQFAPAEGPLALAELQSLRPQAAIIAEPTDLNVVAAHRGVVRWQARTQGRAAHSSRPENGANAIYAMARVVAAIEQVHGEFAAAGQRGCDPVLADCGPPTVCVTTISGGVGANTVPDAAVIDIDRRISPGESPTGAYESLVAEIERRAALGDCRITHDPPWMQSHCLADGPSRAWAERLVAAVRSTGLDSRVVGVPYGTNAATLAAAGVPAAVFGPGSIAQAHTIDEFIELAQLDAAVAALTRIATGEAEIFES